MRSNHRGVKKKQKKPLHLDLSYDSNISFPYRHNNVLIFLVHPPVWCPSLSILVDVQQEFRRVHWGGGAGVQEQLLVLGQVLSWVLLGQPGTVEQLPLEEWQVGLQEIVLHY